MRESFTPSAPANCTGLGGPTGQSAQTTEIAHADFNASRRTRVSLVASRRTVGLLQGHAWRLGWRGGAVIALAFALAAGSFGLGWWGGAASDATAAYPAEGSADAGFLRDMIVHHDQAVAMSILMRDRSADNLMDAIATDIIFNQLMQIGTMRGYLSVWDLPAAVPEGAPPPMAWMGHPTEGLMPGLASPEELQALRTLPVAEAEVLFLRLMIRHHASGVEMAQAGLARVAAVQATQLAETVIPLQFNEIQLMQQELMIRGEAQEPVLDASGMGAMGGMDATAGMDGGMAGHEMATPAP